jgi:peptidoglycan/xylan/chitin deacetylase (PgdA/CDA1 family)
MDRHADSRAMSTVKQTKMPAVRNRLIAAVFVILSVWRTGVAEPHSRSLPIVVYHQIRVSGDEPADGPTAISMEKFEAQMAYLHEQGYVTLSMDEVIRFLRGETFPENVIAIHLDDGWKSGLNAVPILNRFGFKASFWIIADKGIGDPYMDWADIQQLAADSRFEILSHTMTHPWKHGETLVDWVNGLVPGKDLQQAYRELSESRRVLEAKLGRPVRYLAWPSGFYNDRLIQLAQQAGYSALLTIDGGVNHPGEDPLRIHRTMIDGTCDQQIFLQVLQDGRYRDCNSEGAR